MSIKRTPRETLIYKDMNDFKNSALPEIKNVKSHFDNQQPLFSAYLTMIFQEDKIRMIEEINEVYKNLQNLKDRTTRLADIDNAETEKHEILSGIKYVQWKITKLVEQINFRNVSSIAVSKNGMIRNLPR